MKIFGSLVALAFFHLQVAEVADVKDKEVDTAEGARGLQVVGEVQTQESEPAVSVGGAPAEVGKGLTGENPQLTAEKRADLLARIQAARKSNKQEKKDAKKEAKKAETAAKAKAAKPRGTSVPAAGKASAGKAPKAKAKAKGKGEACAKKAKDDQDMLDDALESEEPSSPESCQVHQTRPDDDS